MEEATSWTKEEWDEIVNTLKSKDRGRIWKLLEKYCEYEFGTPLALDFAGALGINIRELVEEYDDFIPIDKILKERRNDLRSPDY